jgi:hypothetical protein
MTVTIDQSLLHQSSSTIKLVQGDTRPPLITSLSNDIISTESGVMETVPLNIANSTVVLKLRSVANTAHIIDIVTGTLLTGYEMANGTVIVTPPYDVPGSGGRVMFNWNDDSLSVAGDIQGEIEITYQDLTVQTVYNIVKFKIREQF